MQRVLFLVILIIAAATGLSRPAHAQTLPPQTAETQPKPPPLAPDCARRIALVIGNGGYTHVSPLSNPASDATLMAQTLKSIGFEVVGGGAQLDLDRDHFLHAVQRFGDTLTGKADVGLFYYAGHGVQVGGLNYLVPVDANPTREADAPIELVDANIVLREMEGSGAKLNVIVLDACRNNPFGGRGLRAAGGGLATMRAPRGTLIAYATQPGNVARDGDDGHSPFTRALATTMLQPGLDVFRTFNQVGLAVDSATNGEQEPWVSNSPIQGEFYFAGPSSSVPIVQPPPVPAMPPVALPQTPAPSTPSTPATAPTQVVVQPPPLRSPFAEPATPAPPATPELTRPIVIPPPLPILPLPRRLAADTCKFGFVWREATPLDHVCVAPGTRTQARDDNAHAAERISRTNHDYGADTCLNGFVWREATPDDHVCVTPGTRVQAVNDNAHARDRLYGH
jgi:hypothetical protein